MVPEDVCRDDGNAALLHRRERLRPFVTRHAGIVHLAHDGHERPAIQPEALRRNIQAVAVRRDVRALRDDPLPVTRCLSRQPHANAVDDDAGIDGRDRRRLRAGRNRHVNTYEVVLDGDGADRILLADVAVAARHLDVFRLAVVERHFHAEFEPWPKRKVRKKLKNK